MVIAKHKQHRRVSVLKQVNKMHKHGKHRSSRQLNSLGKCSKPATSNSSKCKRARKLNRCQRHLQAKQVRETKCAQTSRRRTHAAPFLLLVVPLHCAPTQGSLAMDSATRGVHETVARAVCAEWRVPPTACVHTGASIHISRADSKPSQRLIIQGCDDGYCCCDGTQQAAPAPLHALLDMVKAADCVMFVLCTPSTGGTSVAPLSARQMELVSSVMSHGVRSCLFSVLLNGLLTAKQTSAVKTQATGLFSDWLNTSCVARKLFCMQLCANGPPTCSPPLAASLFNLSVSPVRYGALRNYMVAERVLVCDGADSCDQACSLAVQGYVRGSNVLSANQIVHVCGSGDYEIIRIVACADPHSSVDSRSRDVLIEDPSVHEDEKMVECGGSRIISLPDEKLREKLAESINTNGNRIDNSIDYLSDADWDLDEMLDAETYNTVTRHVQVPPGTSEYQSAWMVGDSDDDDVGREMDTCGDQNIRRLLASMEQQSSARASSPTSEGMGDEDDGDYDCRVDMQAEELTRRQFKAERADSMFPDEVDTPFDVPARIRFRKYRGLASFRSSEWDPNENLPSNYSRLFQFSNYERKRREILKQVEHNQTDVNVAKPGMYVSVILGGVSAAEAHRLSASQCVLFALLPHEHRMSLMNLVLRRYTASSCRSGPHSVSGSPSLCCEVLPNKTRLTYHVGYRRFCASAVFSEHTSGDKHKMVRYFRPGQCVVASVYAPIMFAPAPVLAYHLDSDGVQRLVAVGSLLSVNPERINVKRIQLSGHPFRIHKRSAVIRYMFHNRDDIMWFKPVELKTKYGRRGHIKSPLGTHGHMKCVFDTQIKSQDTVLMVLYKRVFPPWDYSCLAAIRPHAESIAERHNNSASTHPAPANSM